MWEMRGGGKVIFVNQHSASSDQPSAKQRCCDCGSLPLFEGVGDIADEVAEVAAAVEEGDHCVSGGGLGDAVAGGWIGCVGGRVPLGVEGGEVGVGGG